VDPSGNIKGSVPRNVKEAADRFAVRHGLSGREADVIVLAAGGHARKEIASRLDISPKTVAEYWTRICWKTGCANQSHVLARLLRDALGTPK
jgi:DNA-binding CsgD family transcriptional regulator